MDATVSRASSANRCVHGEVVGWYSPRITIEPGYARAAGDAKVAADLAQTARLLFVARLRVWRGLLDVHLGADPVPPSEAFRRWEHDRDHLHVESTSVDGAVSVTSTGLLEWHAHLEAGTVDRLDHDELGRDATEAARGLVAQWVTSLRELNHRHKGENKVERRG